MSKLAAASLAALLGALAMPAMVPSAPALARDPVKASLRATHEFLVKDIVYSRIGGKPRLARLYQPAGTGPFPAVLQIHGGAWNNKDRTDGQNAALDLAADGIVVLAIDFRNGPEAPYPAALADINYGIRWLKAHAREFGSSPDRVGAFGTSSGGHLALLSAIRPTDPRYTAQPLADAPRIDAKLAFVVSGWGVLYPLERLKLAKAGNKADIVKSHDTFFKTEDSHLEATPALIIENGEKVYLPPAMVFQGTKDEWTTPELAQRLETAWKKAGGSMDLILVDGEKHTFVNDRPFDKTSIKTMESVRAFIKHHGAGSREHAAR